MPELDAVPLASACERIRQLADPHSQLPTTGKICRAVSQSEAIAITESEAYQTLLARAHRRTGGVPPERLVRHVLSVTHGGDWPVQRDALDAVRAHGASRRLRRGRGRVLQCTARLLSERRGRGRL